MRGGERRRGTKEAVRGNIPHSRRLGFNFRSCRDALVKWDWRLLLLFFSFRSGMETKEESCSFAASPPLARSATVSAPLTIIPPSHAATPSFLSSFLLLPFSNLLPPVSPLLLHHPAPQTPGWQRKLVLSSFYYIFPINWIIVLSIKYQKIEKNNIS